MNQSRSSGKMLVAPRVVSTRAAARSTIERKRPWYSRLLAGSRRSMLIPRILLGSPSVATHRSAASRARLELLTLKSRSMDLVVRCLVAVAEPTAPLVFVAVGCGVARARALCQRIKFYA